ncbi:uncharacterized protein LOC130640308 [Hydractinia symbiolongicarpus]|uniref:uncharacterized protein LOC130640308 n=1 Tax=Hydractinia symbiolongicarpus TaxID=13093 RepID=UPI00254C82F6|nr:uncharacterized protein LOC130640308 [Hydractinia symbiolongicarpus]
MLPILTLFLSFAFSHARTCETSYLCRNGTNDGGKSFFSYFAGEPVENSILNLTDGFLNTTASNQEGCVTKCLTNATCFAINAGPPQHTFDGLKVTDFVECHLFKENMYSNKSLIVKKNDWIHVSLKNTGCDKDGCLNNGTCIPGYGDDSFTCECPMSHWGDFCERKRPFATGGTVTGAAEYCHYPFTYKNLVYKECTMDGPPSLSATMPWCGTTADSTTFGFCTYDFLPAWKFTFDESKTALKNTGTDQSAQSLASYAKIVSVPDRPGNVLYVFGGNAVSSFSGSNIDFKTCYIGLTPCSKLTLSIWAKMLQKDLEVQIASYPGEQITTVLHEPNIGPSLWYSYQTKNWTMNYRTPSTKTVVSHGPHNPYFWTHFGFQYDSTTIWMYINGNLVATGTSVSESNSAHPGGLKLFSPTNMANSVPGYYLVDDFMFFYDQLIPVQPLYEQGLLENKLKALEEEESD